MQYFNDVPELLVGIHVAGATLVMLMSTLVLLDTSRPLDRARRTDSPDGGAPVETALTT